VAIPDKIFGFFIPFVIRKLCKNEPKMFFLAYIIIVAQCGEFSMKVKKNYRKNNHISGLLER
jgi:hypothetical protein